MEKEGEQDSDNNNENKEYYNIAKEKQNVNGSDDIIQYKIDMELTPKPSSIWSILPYSFPGLRLSPTILYENQEILEKKYYINNEKIKQDLSDMINTMQDSTKIYGGFTEDQYQNEIDKLIACDNKSYESTTVEIVNRDCLELSHDILEKKELLHCC